MERKSVSLPTTPERGGGRGSNLSTMRASTGKLSSSISQPPIPSRYLSVSTTGSCHDLCKYGKNHGSEAHAMFPIQKRRLGKSTGERIPAKISNITGQKLSLKDSIHTPPRAVSRERLRPSSTSSKSTVANSKKAETSVRNSNRGQLRFPSPASSSISEFLEVEGRRNHESVVIEVGPSERFPGTETEPSSREHSPVPEEDKKKLEDVKFKTPGKISAISDASKQRNPRTAPPLSNTSRTGHKEEEVVEGEKSRRPQSKEGTKQLRTAGRKSTYSDVQKQRDHRASVNSADLSKNKKKRIPRTVTDPPNRKKEHEMTSKSRDSMVPVDGGEEADEKSRKRDEASKPKNHRMMLRGSGTVAATTRLKFSRGKVVEPPPPSSSAVRRLKFRRGSALDDGPGGGGGGGGGGVPTMEFLRRRRRDPVESGCVVAVGGSVKVVLRHRDVKRRSSTSQVLLTNSIIEETVTELAQTRKSKVKALVGAFETVISRLR